MYNISYTGTFKKDYKRCIKRNYNLSLLQKSIEILESSGILPINYKPHKLSGNYSDCWECHIQSDWLMIWLQNDIDKELVFIRTGTHADLF
jgi:mRNA interferase YafQ